MEAYIPASEAARRLGISTDDISRLVDQQVLRPKKQAGADHLFAAQDIDRIISNKEPTLSEEAAQMGIQIQQEVAHSVSSLQRLRRRAAAVSIVLAACMVISVLVMTALFKLYPRQISDFFGYYYRFNVTSKAALYETGVGGHVLAAADVHAEPDISLGASIAKPIAAVSLLVIKATDDQQYAQIAQKPATGPAAPGAAGTPGQPGANGLPGFNGTNGIDGIDGTSGVDGVAGLDGASVTDVTTAAGDIFIRNASNVAARLGAGSDGQVLTIVGGIPAWANASGLTVEADTLASVTSRGATSATGLTLSSAANDIALGTLRISGDVLNDLTGSGLSVSSGTLNVTGLANSNLSGAAGITNANLANSSVLINTSGPLSGGGSVALGGPALTLTCSTCLTSGSGLLTVASTTGPDSAIAQGGTLTLAAGSNVTATNNGSGTVTLATSLTPSFTTVNGLTITANGSNTLSIAAGKTLGVNNSITFTGTDGTVFALPAASDTLVGRSSTDTLLNKVIAAGSNTISGLSNTNLSGSAGIANANLANSGLSLAGNSGSGSVSLGGGLTFSGSGITAITASGSTLTVTTTEADTLASVTGRGATTSASVTFNGGLTLSGSVTFSGVTNCRTLATNVSGVLQCGDTTGDGAAFTDTTPATLTDSDTTELFNDATKPNITPTVTSQAVLVSVHARFTGGGSGDTDSAVRIVRSIGSAANCSTSTQVGDSVSNFLTNATDIGNASGTFLDSPATTSQVFYTVCSSVNSKLGNTPVSNRVDVTLVRIGR